MRRINRLPTPNLRSVDARPVLGALHSPFPDGEAPRAQPNSYSRRDFLQAAVVAAGVTAGGAWTASPALASQTLGGAEIDDLVFQGTVIGRSSVAVDVQIDASNVRRLGFTSATTVWRDGPVGPAQIAVGDNLIVHTNRASELTRGWANIARVRGEITAVTESGYQVTPSDAEQSGFSGPIELTIGSGTPVTDVYTGSLLGQAPVVGALVDAVAYMHDAASANGTLVGVAQPGAIVTKAPQAPGPTVTRQTVQGATPDITYCYVTFTYQGIASNYSCCNGCGRCDCGGTNAASSLAWPALDSSCSCCDFTCCNCSYGCTNQVLVSCGQTVVVEDMCNGTTIGLYVRDCGPRQNGACIGGAVCAHVCDTCGYTRSHPVVDLTMTAFSRFHDPASTYCFPTNVSVSVLEPEC